MHTRHEQTRHGDETRKTRPGRQGTDKGHHTKDKVKGLVPGKGRVELVVLAKESPAVVHRERVTGLRLWARAGVDLVLDADLEGRWGDFGSRHQGTGEESHGSGLERRKVHDSKSCLISREPYCLSRQLLKQPSTLKIKGKKIKDIGPMTELPVQTSYGMACDL